MNHGQLKRRFVLEPGLCELLQLPGDKLRHLAIGVNGLTGEHLASLQLIFPNLKHLSIDFGKKMGENGLRSLLQMPGALLNFVYFGLIKFSQFDLNWLARLKFPRLESMVIENCRHLDRSRLLGNRSIELDRKFYMHYSYRNLTNPFFFKYSSIFSSHFDTFFIIFIGHP